MRPNYFIFLGYFIKKNVKNQRSQSPQYSFEPPFQKSWIRSCMPLRDRALTWTTKYKKPQSALPQRLDGIAWYFVSMYITNIVTDCWIPCWADRCGSIGRVASSRLNIGPVTELCPWARHFICCLVSGSTQIDPSRHGWKKCWAIKLSGDLFIYTIFKGGT